MSRGGTVTPVGSTSGRRHHREPQVNVALVVRLGRWPMASEAIQGDECGAYVALQRFSVTEHGMAYGPRGLGSRSRGNSRGSNAPPGRTREAFTGRSMTGGRSAGSHAVREMRNAIVAPTLNVITGELTEIERLMVSSEEGGWKSACKGNSLAAYPTVRAVLRGLGGSNPARLPGGRW